MCPCTRAYPRWLIQGIQKTPRSSVTEHIVDNDHSCNRDHCFDIIYRARNRRLLKFVEAVAIRVLKPELNIQREMDYHLKLPWLFQQPITPPFSYFTSISYVTSDLSSYSNPFVCVNTLHYSTSDLYVTLTILLNHHSLPLHMSPYCRLPESLTTMLRANHGVNSYVTFN